MTEHTPTTESVRDCYTYTMPTEMGIIAKATVHMFAQFAEIGWGLFLAASFLLIVGCLPTVRSKGTK